MKYYAIGIGGSGARSLESLIYMAAAGLLEGDLYVFVLDPDAANGNVERLKEVIENYKINYENLSESGLFKAKLKHPQKGVACSPLADIRTGSKLMGYLQYSSLEPLRQDVCRLFYDYQELEMDMNKGFRAHPSVGAAVMADLEETQAQLWSELASAINNDLGNEEVRVFVFASVFGGTGASGFPAIAEMLRKKIEHKPHPFKIGGALILPYFSFNPTEEEKRKLEKAKELYAKSEHFLLNTRAALEHYGLRWDYGNSSPYNGIYFLGDKDMRPRDFALGGDTQKNPSHYIEFLAALGALDFYGKGETEFANNPSLYAGPDKENEITWDDIPLKIISTDNIPSKVVSVKEHLLYFTITGFAYLDFYLSLLRNQKFEGKSYLSPWYRDFFVKKKVDLLSDNEKEKQKALEKFFRDYYFPWLRDIHESEKLRLFVKSRFSRNGEIAFEGEGIGNLYFGEKTRKDCNDKLWSLLCSQEGEPKGTETGRLLNLIYSGSKRFANSTYFRKGGK